MKIICPNCFLALCLLVAACNGDQAAAQSSSRPSSSVPQAVAAATANPVALKLPGHFTPYASAPIGNHRLCVVGTITDDDGMNQKPMVYLAEAAGNRVLWMTPLDLPADMYQSRATHCAIHGNALFVLLQSDTQSEQALSQTLLRVVRLDAVSGAVQIQKDVDVPAAYSAWVDEGSDHFQWNGDHLVLTGNDRAESNHDSQANFTVHLNGDLNP
jgi:hypothetical protein